MKFYGDSAKQFGCHSALVLIMLMGALVVPVQGINYTFQILLDQNDVIDGRTVGAIDDVALSDNGNIVFTGEKNGGDGGIFTPTSLIAETGDTIGGQTVFLRPTRPDINNAGDIVFIARAGTNASGNEAILSPTSVIADKDSVIAGNAIETILSGPRINNGGTIAFKARTEGNVGQGIYTEDSLLIHSTGATPHIFFPGGAIGLNDNNVASFESRVTSLQTGAALSDGTFLGKTGDLFGGLPWNGVGVGSVTPVVNDAGVGAWFGSAGGASAIMASDGRLIARAGDIVGLETLRDFTSNLAINNDDQVAYVGRFQNTSRAGVFVDGEAVAKFGDTILGFDIATIAGTVDINNAGQVLFSAKVRDQGTSTQLPAISTLFLATPIPNGPTGDFVAKLSTGSPVTLTQTIDTPTVGPVSLEFDYLFQTTTGDLDVFLDGNLLGSLAAPALLDTVFQSASFLLDPSLLGLNDVDLTFEMDGPTGSVILLDNVELAGSTLANGDFQGGSLAPWTITTTGAGQVEIVPFTGAGVPEPATALLCVLAGAGLVRRRRRQLA